MQAPKQQKVILEGRGSLVLRPSNYITSGGEGAIYRIKDIIIKVYLNPTRMIKDNLVDKIRNLSRFKHPFIVAPKGFVFNTHQKPIGFYMPWIRGEPLPRVFTNTFWRKNNFNAQKAKVLANGMYETVKAAHDYGAIMVDANELNWLVKLNKQTVEPRIIDVDSWAIGSWRPTVIMPSIRDWHAKGFSELTDWFSWGIVTFQVFTGIHPYKGRLAGFGPGDMVKRMQANLSVFTPGVRLNKAVRDFSLIPGPLLDWYRVTFQDGERSVPPSPLASGAPARAARIAYIAVKAQGQLIFDKFYEGIDPALKVFPSGIVLLKSGRLLDLFSQKIIGQAKSNRVEIIRVEDGWLKTDYMNKEWRFYYIKQANFQEEEVRLDLEISLLWRAHNRLFAINSQGLVELVFKNLGRPLLAIGKIWRVMPNSTKWFAGVGIEDAMGTKYLLVPFGDSACAMIRTPELDNLEVINAQAGERFVSVIGLDKKGNYQKKEFAFTRDYQIYRLWQGSAENAELNLAILPRGVCATIVQDGELVVFVPSSGAVRKVQDKNINTNMRLFAWDNKVLYIKGGQIWRIRMK